MADSKSKSLPGGSDFSERGLIAHIRTLVAAQGEDLVKGIGDDCAVIRRDTTSCWVVTADTLVEEVHFSLRWHPPRLLGRKAASVNISDIAAMGACPRFVLLSLGLPEGAGRPDWLGAFLDGFVAVLAEHGALLIGGDTVKSGERATFSITAIGEADCRQIIYRSTARAGDAIYVTGSLGDAAAGLALCRQAAGQGKDPAGEWPRLFRAHCDPAAQVETGRVLAAQGIATAMMDLSDGLATDLAHLAAESGLGALVDEELLPVSAELVSAAAQLGANPLDWVLRGGDDYGLLFTGEPSFGSSTECRRLGITRIGTMQQTAGVFLKKRAGRGEELVEIGYQGFDHFS